MTRPDYPVYDADQHYYEPPEAFLRHLPKQFKRDFQYVEVNGRTKLAVAGVLTDYIPNPTFGVVAAAGSHEGWYRGDNPKGLSLREYGGAPVPSQPAFHNGAAHLKVLDEEGIHASILLPTLASVIEERLEHKPETSHAFPEFDPFWARINESKIFVAHHVSDSGYDRIYRRWTEGGQGESRPFEKDPFGEMLDWMGRAISDTLSALVCHGVFDRFTDVRVAVLENGAAWLEPLLARFEHVYSKMPQSFKRDPVETFRRNIFLAPFYEDPVDKVASLIGIDRVLFGSDWPHPEGLKHPLDFFKDIDMLSADDQKKVMHSNLKGLFEGARN